MTTTSANADISTCNTVVDAGMGGAAGAAIGNEIGGRDGAIVGVDLVVQSVLQYTQAKNTPITTQARIYTTDANRTCAYIPALLPTWAGQKRTLPVTKGAVKGTREKGNNYVG